MKKTMIFALSAIMMAAGSVTMNAQEKVVTLDQLLKKNQQKEAPKTEQKAEQKTTQKQAAQKQTAQKQKVAKEPKVKAASAGTSVGGFSTAYVQWNFESQKVKAGSSSTSESGNSISGGFSYAFGIAGATPLYLEPGVALKYVWDKDDNWKFNMLSLKVPVNVVYSFAATENFNIEPYAGVYLRGNLLAKQKFEGNGGWDDDDWDDWDEWDDDYYSDFDDDWETTYEAPSSSVGSKDRDLFSKDDMGDAAWKRIQLGMQFGVRARINQKFMIGIGYSMDLTNISKYSVLNTDVTTKFYSIDISLGICF